MASYCAFCGTTVYEDEGPAFCSSECRKAYEQGFRRVGNNAEKKPEYVDVPAAKEKKT